MMLFLKIALFCLAAYIISISISIVITFLSPWHQPLEAFESIVDIVFCVILGIAYWFAFGRHQLAKYRKRKLNEAKSGNAKKRPLLSKKHITYPGIIIIEVLLIVLLSTALGLSSHDTWFAAIGLDIIFLTIAIMLFIEAKSIRKTRMFTAFCLYLFMLFIIIGLIIINIAFINDTAYT